MARTGRPKTDNPKNKTICFRVTGDEYDYIKNACKLYNKTCLELILIGLEVLKQDK